MRTRTEDNMKPKTKPLPPWPPAGCDLPDLATLDALSRGEQPKRQAELFPERPDHSKAGRLARLLGLRVASDLLEVPSNTQELLTFRPTSWELPAGATPVTPLQGRPPPFRYST